MKHFSQIRKKELLERVGNVQQLAGFQRSTLIEGRGKGNQVIQVRNGSGLQFQIFPDRAFDLGLCEFQGLPVSWISPNGPVSPYFLVG